MSQKNRYRLRKLTKQRNQVIDIPWAAVMGDGNGTVVVPGFPALRYVRARGNNLPLIVHRGGTPDIEGQPVWVGYDNLNRVTRVLGERFTSLNLPGSGGNLTPHAVTHLLSGTDPVYVESAQILTGLCYASSGMIVTINEGWAIIAGQPVKWPKTTIDMTSYVPESGALYALILVDSSGSISVIEGTAVGNYAELNDTAAPAVSEDHRALGLVRLYYGQTSLSKITQNPDVVPFFLVPEIGSDDGDATSIQGAAVPVPEEMDDGKALVYNHTSGDFIYSEAGGAGALDDLTDVNAPAPAEGQVLTWIEDPGEWIASDPSESNSSGATFIWHIDGALFAQTGIGPAYVACAALTITKVTAYIKTPGSYGTTTFDLNINGTSMFTTPPAINYDDADQLVSVIPDTVLISEDDIITLDLDAVSTGGASITISVFAQAIPADLAYNQQVIFTVEGELEIAVGMLKIPNVTGRTLTLSKVYLIVGTAPVDASILVDININNTTIFTTQEKRPAILTTATTGQSADLDVTSWEDGSCLTMDIDQIGSTTAGSDLTVVVVYM